MITLIMNIIGLVVGMLFFIKRPILPRAGKAMKHPNNISIVIPARNEENNLMNLLEDLKNQTTQPFEVICVDDGSDDKTSQVILSFAATLVTVQEKPSSWYGKAWACQCGATEARGNLILFIDADVRLKPEAIERLERQYEISQSVVSVQPYHMVSKLYEQLSFFFNMVLIAGNMPVFKRNGKSIGLFGPVILISKDQYQSINGHSCAKESIVDDLTLGAELNKQGLQYNLFYGERDISFSMYNSGFKDLFQGWTKNFATGASKTPLIRLLMIVIWLTSCASIPISMVLSVTEYQLSNIIIYMLLYLLMALEFIIISKGIGSFNKVIFIFYPVLLMFFLITFIISIKKKYFNKKVIWKGRKIELRR